MALPSEVMTEHLARPLTCKAVPNELRPGCWWIYDANGRRIAEVPPAPDAERRAAEIVEAVNAYPELLKAAQERREYARRVAEGMEP